MDILYCEYIKGFQIQHLISDQDRYKRCISTLKNIEYIWRKFPELANYGRILDRYMELIELKKSYEKAGFKE